MLKRVLILLLLIYSVLSNGMPSKEDSFNMKCLKTIYQDCHQRTDFTEEEVENARIYIQERFLSLEKDKPTKAPCKTLRVRRNFKCLSHEERNEVMDVFKEMYEKGIIGQFATLHWKIWGEVHKFGEFIPWHRWFNHEFEKRMRQINPNVTLPYWSNFEEFDLPHYSIMWKYFGRAGNRFNDHCIIGGVLSNMTQCVRRQWVSDSVIPSWNPIEYIDSVLQRAQSLSDWFQLMNDPHFKVHLSVGGWSGQMSVTDAPYDVIFFPYHDYLNDLVFLRWQLQSDQNLVPESYAESMIYDTKQQRVRMANLERDRVSFFNVSVLDTFHVGFGELCYIHDENIRAINQLISNERNDIPANYHRLPEHLAQKYYPKYYAKNYTTMDSVFEPIINCNRECRPLHHPADFVSTLSGRRLLRLYKYLNGIDLADYVIDAEFEHNEFLTDLNSSGYCSPYVIS